MTGFLHVTTYPVNGDIFINGEYRGTREVNIQINTGIHTISFGTVSGYVTPSPLNVIVNENLTTFVSVEYNRL